METKREEGGEQSAMVERKILRVDLRKGSIESLKDEVVAEHRTTLYVNDELYAIFSHSPSQVKELMVGHLLTEGVIDKPEEVIRIEISEARAHVHLTKKVKLGFSEKPRLILTECSGALKIPPHLWMKMGRVKDAPNVSLNPQIIFRAVEVLNSLACMFRRTGGTHASALLDQGGDVLAFSEDIGRHNAIDKVIGEASIKSADFRKTLLASTGRLTSDMVVKAACVGIPVIVSISAPTDKGIKIAEMVGLTLIGFARGRRFNIYTHPERIKKP